MGLTSACLSPSFAELGRAACADAMDNDGDSLVDCEDGDCAESGVCERHEATCSDGRDNDGDERVDCADPSCLGLTPCTSRRALCSPLSQTGCELEMACFVDAEGATECRAPGAGEPGSPCSPASTSWSTGRAHDCARGLGCQVLPGARLGLCAPYCQGDDDCDAAGAQCPRQDEGSAGLCTTPCFSGVRGAPEEQACPEGFACVSGQQLGVSSAAGGYALRCVHAEGLVAGLIDDEETRCTDPDAAGEVPPAQARCAAPRLCHGSTFEQLRCREPCMAGVEAACASECRAVAELGGGATLGVCLP
jgi:hypothetical protein